MNSLQMNYSRNTDRLNEIQTRVDGQAEALQKRYDALFEDTINKAAEKEKASYEKFKTLSIAHLNKYKTDLQAHIDAMQGNINGVLGEVQQKAITIKAEMEAALDQVKKQYEQELLSA